MLHVTAEVLARYQLWLANNYRTAAGIPLATSTQATAILLVKALYRWLSKRGIILHDPAANLVPPDPPGRLVVAKDHLSQQETIALIDVLAARANEEKHGTGSWALNLRNLAAISLALATGRRCQGLCTLRVEHLDTARNELRVEREKGKAGRVLPVAAWVVTVVKRYCDEARGLLLNGRESPWLFVSQRADRLCERGFAFLLDEAVAETIARNPDLTELPHSIAVHLLRRGADIRHIQQFLGHADLETTKIYLRLVPGHLREDYDRAMPVLMGEAVPLRILSLDRFR